MDTDIDPVSGFSTDDKYNNFMKIMNTARYLDDGGATSPEWMKNETAFILECRTWIPDYSEVNDDISDPSFRKCCSETETLLKNLCQSIWTTGTFNLKIYHMFINHMKKILYTVYSDEILEDMMAGLSM